MTKSPDDKKSYAGDGGSTFLTQTKQDVSTAYTLHDMLFPGGILSKLCKVKDAGSKLLNVGDILYRFKFYEPLPVIVLSGAKEAGRSKFYAGISRAAFRTDAVVIDSGIECGIESFALRRKLTLIGVAPESEIEYPKINPTSKNWNELANGHTHLFLLCDKDMDRYNWGNEAAFKFRLADSIAAGPKKATSSYKCKVVYVIMGDHEKCVEDLLTAIENELPVIIVKGSPLCDSIIDYARAEKKDKTKLNDERIKEALADPKAHVFLLESADSEEAAAYLHFLLTVTPW